MIIFGVDLNDKDKQYSSLVLEKGSIKLNNTTIQAEDELKTNCMVPNERFVLSIHYNSDNSYLFINGVQEYECKVKDTEINANKMCLGNISEELNTLNASFNGNIFTFSVDYHPATTQYKMSQYYPPYFTGSTGIKNVTDNLDLEGYTTEDDLKSIAHVDTSSFALKTNLSSLKTEVR